MKYEYPADGSLSATVAVFDDGRKLYATPDTARWCRAAGPRWTAWTQTRWSRMRALEETR
jgi:hypothetical protein